MRKAVRVPMGTIASNAGVDSSEVVANVMAESAGTGYDAMNNVYTDMVKAGIIDPTKVKRN